MDTTFKHQNVWIFLQNYFLKYLDKCVLETGRKSSSNPADIYLFKKFNNRSIRTTCRISIQSLDAYLESSWTFCLFSFVNYFCRKSSIIKFDWILNRIGTTHLTTVNNEDIRATSSWMLLLYTCSYCWLWTYFSHWLVFMLISPISHILYKFFHSFALHCFNYINK